MLREMYLGFFDFWDCVITVTPPLKVFDFSPSAPVLPYHKTF